MVRIVLYFAALASIIASVAVYNLHSETLGTFIGLWVPTLLLLSRQPCPWAVECGGGVCSVDNTEKCDDCPDAKCDDCPEG